MIESQRQNGTFPSACCTGALLPRKYAHSFWRQPGFLTLYKHWVLRKCSGGACHLIIWISITMISIAHTSLLCDDHIPIYRISRDDLIKQSEWFGWVILNDGSPFPNFRSPWKWCLQTHHVMFSGNNGTGKVTHECVLMTYDILTMLNWLLPAVAVSSRLNWRHHAYGDLSVPPCISSNLKLKRKPAEQIMPLLDISSWRQMMRLLNLSSCAEALISVISHFVHRLHLQRFAVIAIEISFGEQVTYWSLSPDNSFDGSLAMRSLR